MSLPLHRAVERCRNLLLVAIASVSLAGCAGEEAAEPVGEIDVPVWSVSADPIARIGGTDDRPGYNFSRVLGGLRLSDGSIALADQGTWEVRYYDSSGTLLRTVGGRGSGPGELSRISTITRLGDSIGIYDHSSQYLTVFPPDGGPADVRPLAAEGAVTSRINAEWSAQNRLMTSFISHSTAHALAGGRVLLVPQIEINGKLLPVETSLYQDTLPFYLGSVSNEELIELGRFPGQEYYSSRRTVQMRPLGERVAVAVHDTLIFHSATREGVIHVFSSTDGRLLREIELPESVLRRPSDEDIARIREHLSAIEMFGPDYADELIVPDQLPYITELRVGSDANLWAQLYKAPSDTTTRWLVYDSEGTLTGSVEMGMNDSLLDAGPDYVLVRSIGDLDVEEVRMHQLQRQ